LVNFSLTISLPISKLCNQISRNYRLPSRNGNLKPPALPVVSDGTSTSTGSIVDHAQSGDGIDPVNMVHRCMDEPGNTGWTSATASSKPGIITPHRGK